MPDECDLAVIGSGAAGLTAALSAARDGLDVILLEADHLLGGATALSEGMIWVPNSEAARQLPDAPSEIDETEAALAFLDATKGTRFDVDRAAAYIKAGPEVLAFLADAAGLTFTLNRHSRDYYPAAPGATLGRRALNPEPFDARVMDKQLFGRLRPPLGTMMLWGGMSVASRDLPDFMAAGRHPRAAIRVAGHLVRHLGDRLAGWPRGAQLANGNAIVAGLVASASATGVDIRTAWPVSRLTVRNSRVSGVAGPRGEITARRGVLLASGGFNAHPNARRGFLGASPHIAIPVASEVAGLEELIEGSGAVVERGVSQPVLWAPGSLVPASVGRSGAWPHFADRAKPGVICIGPDGRRFANEAMMYHDFIPAMIAATGRHPEGPHGWLICDHAAIRRYGLGPVGPFPVRLGPYQRAGYLRSGSTVPELARSIGVSPDALKSTIARFNACATEGHDPDHGRGANAYDQVNGDSDHGPNPCLGPLVTPPYHAIRLIPADIGTFIGLRVDQNSRALSGCGDRVEGLWAAGNAATPLTGGSYPAAGLTIGAAMIFGWIAARDIADGGGS